LVRPWRAVLAPSYQLLPGGKGSNQAFAAAKVGAANVEFIGCVGDDGFAATLMASLKGAGVGLAGVETRQDAPTACAAVVVDAKGENQICVGSGANLFVTATQLEAPGRLKAGDILLQQMEIPPTQVWAAVERARKAGAHSVLNVAPAAPVPEDVLGSLDFLLVNEHEALEVHAGLQRDLGPGGIAVSDPPTVVTDPLGACIAIATLYEVAVVVTLGAEGAAVCLPRRPPGCDVRRGAAAGCDVMEVEAAPLMDGEKIVDTVGAGDAFVGAFCAALAAGAPLHVCLQRASTVGRYRWTVSKPVLKAPMVSALEATIRCNAFKLCFQFEVAAVQHGGHHRVHGGGGTGGGAGAHGAGPTRGPARGDGQLGARGRAGEGLLGGAGAVVGATEVSQC